MSEKRRQRRKWERRVKILGFVRMVSATPPEIRWDGDVYMDEKTLQEFVAIEGKWIPFIGNRQAVRKIEKHFKLKRNRN